jgi:hypothetical protein
MQILQKRESEETAALENMVQKVEANLQITTVRAYSGQELLGEPQVDQLQRARVLISRPNAFPPIQF